MSERERGREYAKAELEKCNTTLTVHRLWAESCTYRIFGGDGQFDAGIADYLESQGYKDPEDPRL